MSATLKTTSDISTTINELLWGKLGVDLENRPMGPLTISWEFDGSCTTNSWKEALTYRGIVLPKHGLHARWYGSNRKVDLVLSSSQEFCWNVFRICERISPKVHEILTDSPKIFINLFLIESFGFTKKPIFHIPAFNDTI